MVHCLSFGENTEKKFSTPRPAVQDSSCSAAENIWHTYTRALPRNRAERSFFYVNTNVPKATAEAVLTVVARLPLSPVIHTHTLTKKSLTAQFKRRPSTGRYGYYHTKTTSTNIADKAYIVILQTAFVHAWRGVRGSSSGTPTVHENRHKKKMLRIYQSKALERYHRASAVLR